MPCCAAFAPRRSRRPPSHACSHGLVLGCLLAAMAFPAYADDAVEPRLSVRATLAPRAPAIADARFSVRAVLLPLPTRPAMPLGWIGRLEPKSTEALCYGPGSIFHNGFEGLLP
jgi:hypothetical protein